MDMDRDIDIDVGNEMETGQREVRSEGTLRKLCNVAAAELLSE